ncbi:site-2 protease family protein [Maioricimonas sp. JC845]|uniref:site-2 protease family protein n=1 Tax=Maioricimonas sp. JC845 TaxID=3232138 RepID=UPI003458DABA
MTAVPVQSPAAAGPDHPAPGLSVKRRSDLQIAARPAPGQTLWTVKDPLTLEFFQLRDEERFVLEQLDGQSSLAEICEAFHRQFAPRRLAPQDALRFIDQLWQQGLVTASVESPTQLLLERRARRARGAVRQRLGSLLAIRFRGVDPHRLIDALYPFVRWLLTGPALAAGTLLVLAALTLVLVEWETFQRRLPAMNQLVQLHHLMWIVPVVAGVKILHELGHAFACRHFGGTCREVGVMLLAFTPCLYCNVSDAWLFPNKWHRVAVSAAGIAVELVLAAVCTFLWWFSVPGPFNAVCLYVMIVCTTSTLLLNGNPLMRYDGYYILSDLVEVPNLRQRATGLMKTRFWNLVTGTSGRMRVPPLSLRRELLTGFGIAASLYLWLVLVALTWMAYELLKPYGLEPVAVLLAVVVIGSRIVAVVEDAGRELSYRSQVAGLTASRTTLSSLLVAGLLAALLLWPWPDRAEAPALVQPANAQRVYVKVAGRLPDDIESECVRPYTTVAAGNVLAVLENPELELETAELARHRNRQQARVTAMERRQFTDPVSADQLAAARATLADLAERLRRREQGRADLVLKAPREGVVLPAPPPPSISSPDDLPQRQSHPLAVESAGAWLPARTVLCLIGDPEETELAAVFSQEDVSRLETGQPVRIALPECPGQILTGTVAEVAEDALAATPEEFFAAGVVDSHVGRDGVPRPLEPTFMVRIALDDVHSRLTRGSIGRVKVQTGTASLWTRLLRFTRKTFHFDL